MERRGQNRDIGMPNSTSYSHPQITQESPVKLPLAPIVSTPPERRGNSTVSTRRGSAIFSPTQTLTHLHFIPPHNHQPLNSPRPPQKDPTRDPDPATPSTGAALAPPLPPQPQDPPPQPPPPAPPIRYRECLKNHAASTGGHVVDGCGEFMPSGDDGTANALRCAACDCHRNFHRKEVDGEPQHRTPLLHRQNQPSMLAHHHHHHKRSHAYPTPTTMVNFGGHSGGAAAAEQSSNEDLNMFQTGCGGHAVMQPSRKRFRTKFSQQQKDRMQEFAEKIGWRIQKQDEEEVQRFCNETGIKRPVFKVWMHNNKQAIKKRQI